MLGRTKGNPRRGMLATSTIIVLAVAAVVAVAELSLGGLIGSGAGAGAGAGAGGKVAAASGRPPSGGVKGAAVGAVGPGAWVRGEAAEVPTAATRGGATVPSAAAALGALSGSKAQPLAATPGAYPAARTGRATTSRDAASGASAASAGAPPTAGVSPAPAVKCQTDLPLAESPDAPYNFLCRSGFTPLSWVSSEVTMYVGPLTGLQSQAFSVALGVWESAAGFKVTLTADRLSAQIVVTDAILGSKTSGFTTNGYSTDSYACATTCHYDHADLVLSSTSVLTLAAWESTILHELGHVAGLNHVSRLGEVMYPYLAAVPPVAYSPGDLAGLSVLAAGRGR